MTLRVSAKRLLGVLFASLLLCFSHASPGQAVNGTLLGTVTDPTGAVVANGKVIATETSTGTTHESVTNDSGNYTFPDMPPGPYSVTVDSQWFQEGNAGEHRPA